MRLSYLSHGRTGTELSMIQREDKLKLFDALLFNAAFLLIIWTIWWIDQQEPGIRLNQWGTRPRTIEGLIGIITTPFLHGGFDHIKGNTLSFLSLSTFLIFFYRPIAFKVIAWLYIGSGVLLWLIAARGNHIGASGVIYGLAAFLFLSGVVRRDRLLLRVSLAVAFLYGSIIWWVLPIDPTISWEGHLAGVIVGAILAVALRNQGPKRKKYKWELEEELEAENNDESDNDDSNPDGGIPYWQGGVTTDGRPFRYHPKP